VTDPGAVNVVTAPGAVEVTTPPGAVVTEVTVTAGRVDITVVGVPAIVVWIVVTDPGWVTVTVATDPGAVLVTTEPGCVLVTVTVFATPVLAKSSLSMKCLEQRVERLTTGDGDGTGSTAGVTVLGLADLRVLYSHSSLTEDASIDGRSGCKSDLGGSESDALE